MGDRTLTRAAYTRSTRHIRSGESATGKAEQKHRDTGEINPLVDPKGFGVIRRSLRRFGEKGDKFELLVGTPIPVEVRLDTTGSMGGNVDIALEKLPDLYDLLKEKTLARYDLQIAMGVFNDVEDSIVLCRSQFEMDEKISEQLQLMLPIRQGGDFPEDPHYGLFGAAYLTDTYISKVGLKGYDFTISDASARDRLDVRQLTRIFGDEVFEKVEENGYQIDKNNLPSTSDVAKEMLNRSHAFFLQVGDSPRTTDFWADVFGSERIVVLPSVELLPQVTAAIIGLTEGILDLQSVDGFLLEHGVSKENARKITRSVAGIPIGAQAALSGFDSIPMKGDVFANREDLHPIDPSEVATEVGGDDKEAGEETWL